MAFSELNIIPGFPLPAFHSRPMSSPALSEAYLTSSSNTSSELGTPDESLANSARVLHACVYIPQSTVTAGVLKAIYGEHAFGGYMGLCFGDSKESTLKDATLAVQEFLTVGDDWTARDTHSTTYFFSKTPVITRKQGGDVEPASASRLSMFSVAGLRCILSSQKGPFAFYVLERPRFVFPPASYTPSYFPGSSAPAVLNSPKNSVANIPTLDEWRTLWKVWDLVTLDMIPPEMLLQKPIDLRHKCLFYIGHIPTFLDMLLHKSIGGGASEPSFFWKIFERGIDPHVDDPEYCHSHSEVPQADEDWPHLETVLTFRDRVRARLSKLYDDLENGQIPLTRNVARTLQATLEHEGFHVETLLYMLIQRSGRGTLPPPNFAVPEWDVLSAQWDMAPLPSQKTVVLGSADVVLGHNDSEDEDGLIENNGGALRNHEFGWDNESPQRKIHVKAFRVEWRSITNKEFEEFWRAHPELVDMPTSWVKDGDDVLVRTVYGPVPMHVAQHWPVLASYDGLAAYARAKGGRLPTEPELRLFLDTYDVGYEGGSNVGFRNWHPTRSTMGLPEHNGKGCNGGVWEWSSTVLDTHDGISPTKLFPGYSTDFFDTKHQVVLGASYATIPRLAARRTVRNFYQRPYPYAWVGGRVVYDI